MGLLTDVLNSVNEFLRGLGIEVVDATPNHMPAKTPEEKIEKIEETGVEETLKPIEPVEPEEPTGISPPSGIAPIGELGRADRIAVDPEPERVAEEPFTEPPSTGDYPCKIDFIVKEARDYQDLYLDGATVTFLGQTATTVNGRCTIEGRAKIMKVYPITASKDGYRNVQDEISFASAPSPTGRLGATKVLWMVRT